MDTKLIVADDRQPAWRVWASTTTWPLRCTKCRIGYLTAFIVTRNKWRDEMIERHIARYELANRQMGMGQAADI